ncbi:aldo/keto reductase [Flavitalea sp. BT771]|uniref:aldo/keto reductase n=1 Tax=Flavitalea sp. BT771 TaxID=3063329 RepID=UPI0026E43D34|nr:aldo/keto reductase [Flavitalea sp. BT771]MDO6435396.1 aldo/keto reductase [Flavitalea sp. BT771]MDV6224244.1 aldo/keto reductase [Flavitalea sp. BT771]
MSKETSFKKEFTIGDDRIVRRMGYGAMRITGKGIWGPPKDKAEALRVLKRAMELGVNFIDTADSYGPHVSEDLIAEALHPYPPDLVIATKGGFLRTGPDAWTIDARPEHLKIALEGSLTRLKLDQIELYQLHRIDPKVPAEKTFEFLQGVQEEGLVKHIGLSEVSVDDIKRAEEYFDVVSVQNIYSVDNRKWESVLEYCEQTNKAFIPWYPMNAGNVASMKKIEEVANDLGATPHQVALSWLLHHSPNILLIPGTSSVSHLEENIQAELISLSPAQLKKLES